MIVVTYIYDWAVALLEFTYAYNLHGTFLCEANASSKYKNNLSWPKWFMNV